MSGIRRGFAVAVVMTACNAVAGLDDLDFSASAGVGGAAGGNDTPGSGGDAHQGCPCPDDQKCSFLDEAGTRGCVARGDRPAWAACRADTECSAGTWCDPVTSVCRPICDDASSCPEDGGECLPGTHADGVEIPGLQLCTSNCDPLSALPCDPSHGPTTCFFDNDQRHWNCSATPGVPAGSPCSELSDCGVGSACVTFGAAGSRCVPWCENIGDDCVFGFGTCTAVTPAALHNGVEYGVCLTF